MIALMFEKPVSALPFANPLFVTGLLVALPAFATAWWLRQPLPHSGSRWAQAYAPFEAVLGRPAFLFGFLLWCLALISEIVRVRSTALIGSLATRTSKPRRLGSRSFKPTPMGVG